MNCYDTETLIDLSKILGDDPEGSLEHILGCERCKSDLRVSAAVRGGFSTTHQVQPEFTDQVLRALPVPGTWSKRAWALLEPIVAGITILMAGAAASTAAPLPMSGGTLLIAGAAGLVGSAVLRASPVKELVDLG